MKLKKAALISLAALVGSAAIYLAVEPEVVSCGRLVVTVEEVSLGDTPEYTEYTYGSHEYEDFGLLAYWPSGQRRKVDFNLGMLSPGDQEKLGEVGKHELTISYKGASTVLKIDVIRYCQIVYRYDIDTEVVFVDTHRYGETVTLRVPAYAGYEFVGWYSDASFSGIPYPDSVVLAGDLYLYGRFEELLS